MVSFHVLCDNQRFYCSVISCTVAAGSLLILRKSNETARGGGRFRKGHATHMPHNMHTLILRSLQSHNSRTALHKPPAQTLGPPSQNFFLKLLISSSLPSGFLRLQDSSALPGQLPSKAGIQQQRDVSRHAKKELHLLKCCLLHTHLFIY